MTPRSLRLLATGAAVALAPSFAVAQQPSTPTVVTPSFDFSGVVFGSYSTRFDSAGRAAFGGSHPNQFSLDRAYLTFRMPAGDNGAIRVTTDVFQNTNTTQNAYYQGWAVRIKYAYLQYTGLRNEFGDGSSLLGRIGILHTVVIDHEENFWPRYLQQVALEKNGFFSSADLGAASLLTLGKHMGEIYGTVTNGPGYTSYEKDRFKDLALRVSLTPLGNEQNMNAVLKSFTISPWVYWGWVGSNFAAGGNGQIGTGDNGAVTEGLPRDRYGVFVGVREHRLTAGAEWAQRKDGSETGLNTLASPRVEHDSTGRLLDGFIVARPLEMIDPSQKSNWAVIARYDHFTPNTSPDSPNYAGTTPKQNFWILGTSYDVNQKITFALDWQKLVGSDYPAPVGTNVRAPAENSVLYLHFQANF
ncbi:MAG TPA: hypothetical protein VH277_18870 [Gemmatimonadaceae bacterium]|nr:hypothetical protein [Gemmatimonadaceae bacterium]